MAFMTITSMAQDQQKDDEDHFTIEKICQIKPSTNDNLVKQEDFFVKVEKGAIKRYYDFFNFNLFFWHL